MNGDYGYDVPEASNGGNFLSNIAGDFFDTARARLGDALSSLSSDTSQGPTMGSQLFEAIYQYGRGQIDAAREKAVGAFLMTSEGRKLQNEGVRQTAMDYMPIIIIALVGLFFFGVLLGKR